MKKIKTLFLLFLCTTVLMMQAQQVTISPIPQTITWGAKAFNNTTSYFLTGSETADQDAVDLFTIGVQRELERGADLPLGLAEAVTVRTFGFVCIGMERVEKLVIHIWQNRNTVQVVQIGVNILGNGVERVARQGNILV